MKSFYLLFFSLDLEKACPRKDLMGANQTETMAESCSIDPIDNAGFILILTSAAFALTID